MGKKEATVVFLVANSKRSGQYYYDEKERIVYLCHFRIPKPGEETAPFTWVFAISLLVFISLFPRFFVHPFSSILFNLGSFALVVCLGVIYARNRQQRVKKEGIAYVLEELSRDELKELENEFFHGIAIYTSLSRIYLRVLVFCSIGGAALFFFLKHPVFSIYFLLYAIEFWGYDFYFTRQKHQKDYFDTIEALLKQWENRPENEPEDAFLTREEIGD